MDVLHGLIDCTKERMNHRGLAGANLSGQQNEAFSLHYPVVEEIKRFSVAFA
jgi:hypothetical protein